MRRRLPAVLALLLSIALLVLAAGTAAASPPSPANCFVDPCLVACPIGHIPFHVTVRDAGNVPIANSLVQLDFCGLPAVDLCFTTACSMSAFTDVAGMVTLNPQVGGASSTLSAVIRADGVTLATRAVAALDQTGDLIVNGTDVAAVTLLLGSNNAGADFDCDGLVTPTDVAFVQAHIGHTCAGPVHDASGTWGRVKTIYR